MNSELVRDVVGILVFLPAIAVWLIAMVDVITRKDFSRRRRVLTAVLIGLVFPLALLYLLGRPPSSVRRGPESTGDPRTPLVRRLEAPSAQHLSLPAPTVTDDAYLVWIDRSLEGDAPPTR